MSNFISRISDNEFNGHFKNYFDLKTDPISLDRTNPDYIQASGKGSPGNKKDVNVSERDSKTWILSTEIELEDKSTGFVTLIYQQDSPGDQPRRSTR